MFSYFNLFLCFSIKKLCWGKYKINISIIQEKERRVKFLLHVFGRCKWISCFKKYKKYLKNIKNIYKIIVVSTPCLLASKII